MTDAAIRADTVVVGSGVGGATVARELARQGEEVVVLEKGRDHHLPIGTPLAYATIYDIKRSKDGVLVRRGITTGGSTILYSGNAYDPPAFLKDELGIDLGDLAAETKEELGVRALPESFYEGYAGTKRLVEAAGGLGYRMKPQERFIDPDLCDPRCDRCLFGCRRNAKWTAREYLDDAVRTGARLITRIDVRQVLVSEGAAEGVMARTPRGPVRVLGNRVVLAAGGLGTPTILQRSGVSDAGSHFFTDPMTIVAGVLRHGPGTHREVTFTFADDSHEGEFMMGNVGAVNAFMAQLFKGHFAFTPQAFRMGRIAGLFVKLCDEPSGRVDETGAIHKAFTPLDEERMRKGVEIARSVLIEAGVLPETISEAKGIGGHPGGTAAIGRVVDETLQTRFRGLYVCDNSLMPRSGGVPPVLTLIALAKKAVREMWQVGTSSPQPVLTG